MLSIVGEPTERVYLKRQATPAGFRCKPGGWFGGGSSIPHHVVGCLENLLQRWLPAHPLQEQVGWEGCLGPSGQRRLPRLCCEQGEQVHLGLGRRGATGRLSTSPWAQVQDPKMEDGKAWEGLEKGGWAGLQTPCCSCPPLCSSQDQRNLSQMQFCPSAHTSWHRRPAHSLLATHSQQELGQPSTSASPTLYSEVLGVRALLGPRDWAGATVLPHAVCWP